MEFRVLGPLEVLDDDGRAIDVPGARLRSLLLMLVLRRGAVVRTDELIDALWGDDPPQWPGNALQVLVSKLRRTLGPAGPSVVVTQPSGYVLDIEAQQVDALRFRQAIADGRALLAAGDASGASRELTQALQLWRGTPDGELDLLRLGETGGVDLEQARLDATEDRLAADLALGRHESLVAELEPLTTAYPFRERLWALLMTALYRSGRQAEALRAFQTARAKLADELGIDPGPELRQLEVDILSQAPVLSGPQSRAAPEARSAPRTRTNLRPPLTACIGRDDQLAALHDLLSQQRFVTLVGPGGVGKTRVALEAGARALDVIAPTVLVVELAAVTSGDAVGAVAAAMSVPGGRSLDRLIAAIGDSRLLLILDNCEHIVSECAELTDELLRSCPGLRLLATSREALAVPGEIVWPLPPLALGDAMDLFAARAAAAAPNMPIGDDDPVVAEICRRLDGLPLALELAAARLRAFPLPQLLRRLDDRFGLLTSGSRTAQARQQTLQALVEWSYDLLFDSERRVFERLSVFSDGCSIDGAESVCAYGDIDRNEVAELLARLVDKSFLTTDLGGPEPRYRMLQTLVEFGLARLAERGEVAETRNRHLRWVDTLAGEMESRLRGPEQIDALARLRQESAALRGAVAWATEDGQTAAGLRIAVHLGWYHYMIGDLQQGYRWLVTLLAAHEAAADEDAPSEMRASSAAAGAPDDLVARAMAWSGMLGLGQPTARHYASRAVELGREGSNPRVLGEAALLYAFPLTVGSAQLDRGRELAAEARAAFAAVDDRWSLTHTTALDALICLASGELAQAARLFESTVVEFRSIGDEGTAAFAELRLSEVLERRGDLEEASAVLNRGLAFAARTGIESNRARYLSQLSWLHARGGASATAMSIAEESMAASTEPCNPVVRAHALLAHGAAARRCAAHELAASSLIASEELHRGLGMSQWVALCLTERSGLAQEMGDDTTAGALAVAALETARQASDPWTVVIALQRLAAVEATCGSPSAAAGLLEVGTALRSLHGLGESPTDHDEAVRLRAAVGKDSNIAAFTGIRRRLEAEDFEAVMDELTSASSGASR